MEIFFRDMTTAVKLLKTISIFLSPPAYQATYALKGQKSNCLIYFFNYDFFFSIKYFTDKFCQGNECLVTQSHVHNNLWRWQKSICSNSKEIIVPLENHFFYTQKNSFRTLMSVRGYSMRFLLQWVLKHLYPGTFGGN